MKKFFFSILVLTSCNSLSSDVKTVELPKEAIGEYAFNILKNINNMSEDEFMSSFISKEEALLLAKKIELDENIISRIEQTSGDKWKSRGIKKMKKIRTKAVGYNINWDKIEYLDALLEDDEVDGFPTVSGDLFFSHDKKIYKTSIVAFRNGNKYQLGVVEGLREE